MLPDAAGDRPDAALSDFATETGDFAKTFIENAIKSNDGVRPGRLIPLTVGGLIYASSMVMLDSARRGTVVPVLARWLLGLGIAATLAANVARGLGHGVVGATVAAWPPLALVGSYELLMMVIRGSQKAPGAEPCNASTADPLQQQAAEIFAGQLPADRFRRSERSAPSSTLASPGHNPCGVSSRKASLSGRTVPPCESLGSRWPPTRT